VEIRQRVEEVVVPKYVEPITAEITRPKKQLPLFTSVTDDELLSFGVPPDWLALVKDANEDSLLELVEHLPQEAAEALLELATGGKPRPATESKPGLDPFEHPDALRRFRVMTDVDALRQALDYPWDKWTVFLHPAQRQLIEREYTGPARVSGSAGTGKTIVALHRAVFLAKKWPECRVLMTTFSETLAKALHDRLRRLVSNEPRLAERLEVSSLTATGIRLFTQQFGVPNLLTSEQLFKIVDDVARVLPPTKFSTSFLVNEWWEIVDAWQLSSWESYRDVRRLGRKTRLSEKLRQTLWTIFAEVNDRITAGGWISNAGLFVRLASMFKAERLSPFDYIVIDESQDITASQLGFLSALAAGKPEALFFAGDLGQRIFQTPFSWKSVGVDIRGRSRTLTVNYRTSHQIRQHADHLLGPEVSDVDGVTETRKGTISVFNGPAPEFNEYADERTEAREVSKWIAARLADGVSSNEIGVIVRSEHQLARAKRAVELTGKGYRVLDDQATGNGAGISICTMHVAKGLEFRSVVVMACDDQIVPLQHRIAEIADEGELEEVYVTERHLLYVAITRARDHLLVSSAGAASEFMEDLRQKISHP
jgi:superfamily I DNA/RNA helicase